MVDEAEFHLWQSIQRGEPWAITFTLRTLGRNRGYGEKIEQAGPQDGPLVLKVVYAGHEPGTEASGEHGDAPDSSPPHR